MKLEFYLVVSSTGVLRTTKNKPSLIYNEVAVKINLELPNAIFQKPSLSAEIKVTDDQVRPTDIDVKMTQNIQDAIQKHIGIPITLKIVSDKKEEEE